MPVATTGTGVDCEKNGHCPHEGTAVGSYYCCRCGAPLYSQNVSSSYAQFIEEQKRLIDEHPEWGSEHPEWGSKYF